MARRRFQSVHDHTHKFGSNRNNKQQQQHEMDGVGGVGVRQGGKKTKKTKKNDVQDVSLEDMDDFFETFAPPSLRSFSSSTLADLAALSVPRKRRGAKKGEDEDENEDEDEKKVSDMHTGVGNGDDDDEGRVDHHLHQQQADVESEPEPNLDLDLGLDLDLDVGLELNKHAGAVSVRDQQGSKESTVDHSVQPPSEQSLQQQVMLLHQMVHNRITVHDVTLSRLVESLRDHERLVHEHEGHLTQLDERVDDLRLAQMRRESNSGWFGSYCGYDGSSGGGGGGGGVRPWMVLCGMILDFVASIVLVVISVCITRPMTMVRRGWRRSKRVLMAVTQKHRQHKTTTKRKQKMQQGEEEEKQKQEEKHVLESKKEGGEDDDDDEQFAVCSLGWSSTNNTDGTSAELIKPLRASWRLSALSARDWDLNLNLKGVEWQHGCTSDVVGENGGSE